MRKRKLSLVGSFVAAGVMAVLSCHPGTAPSGWDQKWGAVPAHRTFPGDCGVCHAGGNGGALWKDLTFDHVVPIVKGGGKTWENIVTCCLECNHKKGGRTPEEAGMHLIRQPREPSWVPTVLHVTIGLRTAPEAWRDYLYWNVELE